MHTLTDRSDLSCSGCVVLEPAAHLMYWIHWNNGIQAHITSNCALLILPPCFELGYVVALLGIARLIDVHSQLVPDGSTFDWKTIDLTDQPILDNGHIIYCRCAGADRGEGATVERKENRLRKQVQSNKICNIIILIWDRIINSTNKLE